MRNQAKNNIFLKRSKMEAKRNEKFDAKKSEMKRNLVFIVLLKTSETRRNDFCFAIFRFEAKVVKKRKWDALAKRCGKGKVES